MFSTLRSSKVALRPKPKFHAPPLPVSPLALCEAGHHVDRLELEPALARTLLDGSYDVAFPVTHGRLGEDGGLQGLLEVLGLPYVGSGVLACALACDKIRAKHAFRAHKLPIAPPDRRACW